MSSSKDINLVTKSIFWTCNQGYHYPNVSASIGISFASAYLLDTSAKTSALIGILFFTFSQISKFEIVSINALNEDKEKLTPNAITIPQKIRELEKTIKVRDGSNLMTIPALSYERKVPNTNVGQSYNTLFDGPRSISLSQVMQPDEILDLNEYIRQEIMQDEDYLEFAEKAGVSREIASKVLPMISTTSGFTIIHEKKPYYLQLNDNLRRKIQTLFNKS
ncbi:MAG: hypothetical protein K1000chlam1_01371 [Candidatus Anoxychlamydiales bacterium]|nr:hypothetical protein [Candidatus Anoxychlamydiales bacterium]